MTAETTEIAQHFLAEVGRFEPLLLHYGLVIIMAAVAVEGFGIPAPGQTLLVVGAVLAPILAVLGALATVMTESTVVVERVAGPDRSSSPSQDGTGKGAA